MSVISEVKQYLIDQGVGDTSEIFYSYMPDIAQDLTVAVLDTGGVAPDIDLPTYDPTFQIFIRSVDYDTGKTALDTIRGLLHQKTNSQLVGGGKYFYFIHAQSEGGHIGRNDNGKDEFSMNFICKHR